jgi:hypothetical protein
MPRRVELTVEPQRTDDLVQQISSLVGVIGVQVQRGASRVPSGDVIIVDVASRTLPALLHHLATERIGLTPGASFSTSEPGCIVASSSAAAIVSDSSEVGWEEMDAVMAKNSNMTVNALLVMGIAGVLATIGIATNALHIVIAAMLIAPGFQPIVRTALGIVASTSTWRLGLAHLLQGYGALALAAAVTALVLQGLGRPALGGEASYLPAGVLISYWTSVSVPSLIVTTVAGVAGAILIATDRAVLTAGVMVALALVPGAAIAGLAIASGEPGVAVSGAVRWVIEVGIVLVTSLLVLSWKRSRVHRRASLIQPG